MLGNCCCNTTCYQDELRERAPLRLQVDMVEYRLTGRHVYNSFVGTMRWYPTTPEWLLTFGDTGWTDAPHVAAYPECRKIGQDTIGTEGLWLSDEEKVWYEGNPHAGIVPSPNLLFDQAGGTSFSTDPDSPWFGIGYDPKPQRLAMGRFNFGFTNRQPDVCLVETAIGTDRFCARLNPDWIGITGEDCKVGMVRTNGNYPFYFMQTGIGVECDQRGACMDAVNYGMLSKITRWLTFSGDPVYAFGVYPYFHEMTYIDGEPWALIWDANMLNRTWQRIAHSNHSSGSAASRLYEYTLTEFA